MATEKRLDLVDRAKIYELACTGCTKHGELPGECYYDEPCERLIFAFTVAEPVDAVEVVRCQDCEHWKEPWLEGVTSGKCMLGKTMITEPDHFCSYGERKNNK